MRPCRSPGKKLDPTTEICGGVRGPVLARVEDEEKTQSQKNIFKYKDFQKEEMLLQRALRTSVDENMPSHLYQQDSPYA